MTTDKSKVGRKPKYTPETLERIVQAIRIGASYEDAATFGGISYRTFFNWMQKGEQGGRDQELVQFFQAVKRAKMQRNFKWLSKIEEAANEGDWHAAAWKLKYLNPDEYGLRSTQKVELSGTIEQHHSGSLTLTAIEKIADRIPTKLDDWRKQRGLPTRAEKDALTG